MDEKLLEIEKKSCSFGTDVSDISEFTTLDPNQLSSDPHCNQKFHASNIKMILSI